MILLMFGALLPAVLADIGAHPAEVGREPRPPAHERRRQPADRGAIPVQPDALGHHLHVRFAQTGVGAVLALLGTADASLDARLVFLMHGTPPVLELRLELWVERTRAQ
jgi:hypothetical protein